MSSKPRTSSPGDRPAWGTAVIVLAIIGWLVLRQFDADSPLPDADVARTTHHATVAYSHLCADALDEAARKFETGEFTTDREFRDWFDDQEDAARWAAFEPVGERLNQIGPDWPADAPRVLRALADGHRKVR